MCNSPQSSSNYRQACQNVLLDVLNQHSDLYFYIDACATNLCLVNQNDAGHNQVREVLERFIELVKIHVKDRQRAIGKNYSTLN